jgi:hypothetical protein
VPIEMLRERTMEHPPVLRDVDGTPLATSVTGLARVIYGVEQPSDAQRAAVRRAVRRLEAGGHVEVHRLCVGRTYTQQRAHPRFWPPRYDRRLAVCTGKGDVTPRPRPYAVVPQPVVG